MTLGVRLLQRAASGYTRPARVFDLGLAGWWNDIIDMKAWTYNGKTYIGFINDSGSLYVASLTHSTGAVSGPTLVGSGFVSPSGDIHNSIAVLVRNSDRRIVIVEVAEGGQPLRNISTNPEDISSFGTATAILDTGIYTYCSLVQLATDSDALYYWGTFWPGSVSRLAYARSADGGSTWGSTNQIIKPSGASLQIYHRIGTDQANRVHMFFTDTDRSFPSRPSSVYHCYMEGFGSFFQSDGTAITGPFPIFANSATLVMDTSSVSASCRPEGWAIDSNGHPACVINVRDSTTTERVYVARFNGSSWSTHLVTSSVGQLISGSAMVKNDPNTLYIPRYDSGSGNLEMWIFTSGDDGTTWYGNQLTSGSTSDNDGPDTPLNAASGLRSLWGFGTYTGPSFSFDLHGWGT